MGLQGHVTKEKALACLQSCPLLENMSEWSHWQFVFKPELGELREFLHKHGGVRTIHIATGELMLVTVRFGPLKIPWTLVGWWLKKMR